jgi:hypothetical protein
MVCLRESTHRITEVIKTAMSQGLQAEKINVQRSIGTTVIDLRFEITVREEACERKAAIAIVYWPLFLTTISYKCV